MYFLICSSNLWIPRRTTVPNLQVFGSPRLDINSHHQQQGKSCCRLRLATRQFSETSWETNDGHRESDNSPESWANDLTESKRRQAVRTETDSHARVQAAVQADSVPEKEWEQALWGWWPHWPCCWSGGTEWTDGQTERQTDETGQRWLRLSVQTFQAAAVKEGRLWSRRWLVERTGEGESSLQSGYGSNAHDTLKINRRILWWQQYHAKWRNNVAQTVTVTQLCFQDLTQIANISKHLQAFLWSCEFIQATWAP